MKNKEIEKIITDDEFDDSFQNNDIYNGKISGNLLQEFFYRNYKPGKIIDIGCGSGGIFEQIPEIEFGVEPNQTRANICKEKYPNKKIIIEWAEKIELDLLFDTVLMWGTFTFVRSPMDVLYSINKLLKISGVFIFDVTLETTIPIAQTVHGPSFINWIKLFGFDLIEKRIFGKNYHRRMALAIEKIRKFDPRYFRMPQCLGPINNYFEERDWYLR